MFLRMESYLQIVQKIIKDGVRKKSRTGVDCLSITGMMFEHDMSGGFPLLTTKKMPFKLISSELEFFIKGITDKAWLQNRNNHIWDEWCSPYKVKYAHDDATKKKMMEERELGPIYGWQWRNFGAQYLSYDKPPVGKGVDQLRMVIDTIKNDPESRRMLVCALNPKDQDRMALPPCHYAFQVTVDDGRVNLIWMQRSIDSALGLPFNIASYALLLHLIAKEANLNEGRLIGFLGDAHIYMNHIDGLREQLKRETKKLPAISTKKFTSIFDWEYIDSEVDGYDPHPSIKFEIAV